MDYGMILQNETARKLYKIAETLPVIDYHCHLSPKEIAEDKPYNNLAQIWLYGDHYKWRLMRAFGVPEEFITGSRSDYEKFMRFAECVGLAAGNPVSHWTKLELRKYFGITAPLNASTADAIWKQTGDMIREQKLSPGKLLQISNVKALATTDDPADALSYHQQLQTNGFFCRVTPSFRPDRALLLGAPDYVSYLAALSEASGVEIKNVKGLLAALSARLDAFCELGCTFTDVGIEDFPTVIGTEEEAEAAFSKALSGESLSLYEKHAFLGYMEVALARAYRERGLVMQIHYGVKRNANTRLYEALGADAGGDCIGERVSQNALIALLDAMHLEGALPKTILYPLWRSGLEEAASAAASFEGVMLGAAWWFQDNEAGIRAQLETYARALHLATFPGMLTDSRSFMSYARHDYFRMILANLLSDWIKDGLYPDGPEAVTLMQRICYQNIQSMMDKKEE